MLEKVLFDHLECPNVGSVALGCLWLDHLEGPNVQQPVVERMLALSLRCSRGKEMLW